MILFVRGNPLRTVDPFGLYTLGDANRSLLDRKAVRGKIGGYIEVQMFDKWLRLERENKEWLNELTPCPEKLPKCGSSDWSEPTEANKFHPGGVWEVRSKTTKGGHSNQCIYDGNEDLMRNAPAAGSADYKACPNPPFCSDHYLHDVATFELAEKLGRVDDYYDVRPVY